MNQPANHQSFVSNTTVSAEWWRLNLITGNPQQVVKSRREQLQSSLEEISRWEKALKEEKEKPLAERNTLAIESFVKQVSSAKERFGAEAQALRNCVRFAVACKSPDSEDFAELTARRSRAGFPTISTTSTEISKDNLKDLVVFASTVEEYILAKQVAAKNSLSDPAMKKVWEMCSSAVLMFKRTNFVREEDDTEQQAALGVLRACELYEPNGKKAAKLATYATYWIRRKVEARKGTQCRPGMTRIKGKIVNYLSIDAQNSETNSGERGQSARFHPTVDGNLIGVALDVRNALAKLKDDEREVAERMLLYSEKPLACAEDLGISVAKVKVLLKRAKESLARTLADHATSK